MSLFRFIVNPFNQRVKGPLAMKTPANLPSVMNAKTECCQNPGLLNPLLWGLHIDKLGSVSNIASTTSRQLHSEVYEEKQLQ